MFNHSRLKELREKSGLSQDDLVYKLRDNGIDIVRATWGSWENGETFPRSNELVTIANFFKVKPAYFFN